jgi:hypothetical protein
MTTRLLIVTALLLLATSVRAERITEVNGRHVQLYPTKEGTYVLDSLDKREGVSYYPGHGGTRHDEASL